ncbi:MULTISPECIES: hypothetical protein [Streptomyces]|uniref:Uncharacterized protein n=2 Tax=Streptomyces TaxID=1883 RepID=A0ABV9IXN5_9ACTN
MLDPFWTIVVTQVGDNKAEPIIVSGRQKSPRDLFEHVRYMRELPGVDMGLGEESSRVDLYENYKVVAAFKGNPTLAPVPTNDADEDATPLPEPKRIPVEDLKDLAGRHVHFVGEFDDPWDIATGDVELKNPAEAYMVIDGNGKAPVDNSYFSFSWEVELEMEEMAKVISDLPVCLVVTHADMETGLCPTEKAPGWQWSVVEAFTRLGILPPTNEMHLSDEMDISRSPELITYLVSAFRKGVERSVVEAQYQAVKKAEWLDGVHSKVLAST